MANVSASKRRKLSDLYLKGTEFSVDDGQGAVEVYIQKLSPAEHRQAMDRAHAERAKITAVRRLDDEDERRLSFMTEAEFDGLFGDRQIMIDFLSSEELSKARQSNEAELADKDEWSKNEYLNGLRDAWFDGLSDKYRENPEDEEASQVYAELERFYEQVEKLTERSRRSIRRDYDDVSDEQLRRQVVDGIIEAEADQIWVDVFRKAQLFFAVRDPEDHTQRYFEEMEDLGFLDPRVLGELYKAMDELTVEPPEGKE